MCLAFPARLVELGPDGHEGVVELWGVKRKVSLALVDKSKLIPGRTYVVVHAGFAISILDEEEAKRTLELLDEVLAEARSA
ncbi:hypothetical protein DRO32_05030 [Candidatus Bathyarchaeota archaeon]|nr:MAG: hypothetical protein DRO32_05030 [Candidatus Bathyarchaeota archaeon]